jgi:mono/diheme cytochrome c family protein
VALAIAAIGASPALAEDTSYGQQVYRKANCMGCHKWHGAGGGGYGGAALSLRATQLTREQIVEVVICGRPGTNMPYHASDAYTDSNPCYGGMSKDDLGDQAPVHAAQFLSPRQIEGVVDYVVANLQGKGEPNKGECAAFWGAQSHECQAMQ